MRAWPPTLMIAVLALAGCTSGGGGSGDGGDGGAPPVDVDANTGGIRGVVVDQAIVPIEGATVALSGGKQTTSGPGGLFNFSRLEPGDYFVSVSKPGYKGVQASATVEAGVPDPPLVRVLLERLTTAQPYLEHFKLDGYYECAYGIIVQTDACDWAYRTAWDEYNHSQGSPPPGNPPRTVQRFANTQYIDIGADAWAVIQEAFWEHETISRMMISLDETPIDNACDCSPSYLNVVAESPTYGRLDLLNDDGTVQEPAGLRAAARGFIPFADADPTTSQAALNLQFVIMTTVFHNYVPAEGWTFETRDSYPIG